MCIAAREALKMADGSLPSEIKPRNCEFAWHFAYTCILNEDIRRKARNWSWDHIREHRQLLKEYRNMWISKLTVRKLSSEVLKRIEDAENYLDVFNLNIARQQAEIEVDRRGLKRLSEQSGWMSWVSSWWSSDNGQQQKNGKDVAAQFRSAMTSEEKSKLFDAIGYQENQSPTLYPKEFVENSASFTLDTFKVMVRDDTLNDAVVVSMVMSAVCADVQQRPSADAIRFSLKVSTFHVSGLPNKLNKVPSILRQTAIVATDAAASAREEAQPQLLLLFETHPLDNSCDQHVQLKTQPLDIVYDASTVNKLLSVLKPPESVRLKQLTDAAMAKYEDIKARSAAGLEYALQRRTRLKVSINVSPTCLRIPEFGDLAISQKMLIVDFGSLIVHSMEAKSVVLDTAFYKKSEEEKLSELMKSVYDEFRIEFKSLAVMFTDAVQHRGDEVDIMSKVDILRPTGFEVVIQKAAVVDLRFPR
ncbi:unnamed protein product [Soboliphyme baturini]|uniref:VPS13_mid_rpt domain-containing protein n=1 Tax=Soboliphyme baturini TaxID=241478 RepID=A0A183IRH7_9BILA|nr:unnamed protein product [Soboliphyme baturini]